MNPAKESHEDVFVVKNGGLLTTAITKLLALSTPRLGIGSSSHPSRLQMTTALVDILMATSP